MTPAAGMRLGRYELLDRLGSGGMGEVFRARDHELGREVAIKTLPARFATDPDRLARFAREARAASSLNYPNIVTIHEIGRADDVPYIVMELVQGRTLRQLMSGALLPTRRVLDLGAQIAEGLSKAHEAGIVHRDLKPENVMVTGDGLVKILDFGLAKLTTPHGALTASRADGEVSTHPPEAYWDRSQQGAIVGTVGYMSPEQAAGKPVDFRSDQFSLGSILYELASGRRAFQRESPVQTLSAIIDSDPTPLSEINDRFPAPARWIVERCLSKDPAGRYASTADLAGELRAVRDHLPELSSGVEGTRRREDARRPWWRWLGLAAALLVVTFALPPLRHGLWGPLFGRPLPAEKRIAVLPFLATGASEDDQQLCNGLSEYVVARLGQIERFQRSAWVVPSVEVRQSGVVSAEGARRTLGATVVITGSLQREGARTVVTASVIDATTLRQLRAATLEVVPGKTSLLEQTVDAVIRMLEIEIGPDGRSALRAGGTGVAEAATLYAQARGATPLGEARTAIERYDQEQGLERAIDLLHRALEQDPRFALAHAALGEAYWRLSRFTRKAEHVTLAEQHCRRALDLDSLVVHAWVTMGMIHAGTGRPEEAIAEFRRALDGNPRNADAHRELARALARLGRTDEAEATYRKAIELDPSSWVNYNQFGAYLVRQGQPATAQAMYEKAIALVPDNARVWSGLGAAYYGQARYDDAKRCWERSLELWPTSTAASNLGTRLFLEGRFADAARAFERAIGIDDRDYRVWRNLAAARMWTGAPKPPAETPGQASSSASKPMPAAAREAFERAAVLAEQERALDPLDPEVHADLADTYASLGDATRARRAALEAGRLGGKQPGIAFTLAGTYETLGDRDTALTWLAQALALGLSLEEVEHNPSLARLRADARYEGLVTSARAARTQAPR